jgi:hypothetical protein
MLRWWRCGTCGGVSVPMQSREAAGCGAWSLESSGGDCPRCETRRRRVEPLSGSTTVWYDTFLRDWVVRLPVERFQSEVILPLELWWFDVPWVEVYRAAADLAFAAEMFELREIEAAEEAEDF